ncbi:hypothetical protein LB505_003701 [Fusarium chuoi]|nr:hypothetical protein LB503_001275 [Fusarium chuoi]KAI1043690.1 hypothetical protein LB505_003701 [Fusarium chuoi]
MGFGRNRLRRCFRIRRLHYENQPKERFGAQHHTDIGIDEQLIHRLRPFGGDCTRVQLQHYSMEPLRLPKLFVSDLEQHL